MIDLDPEQLPSGDEVLSILQQERSQLNVWINVAVSEFNLKLVSNIILYIYDALDQWLELLAEVRYLELDSRTL